MSTQPQASGEQFQQQPAGINLAKDVQVPAAPVEIRRGPRTRFLAPASNAAREEIVVSRNVLSPRKAAGKNATARERKIAGDLPEWEPLPPGEVLINRSRH